MAGLPRTITVTDAGVLSTVQDLGRHGQGDSGVSPSGALDWYSARAANRLAYNADGLAVIESTLSGVSLLAGAALRVAVAGAAADVTIGGVRAPLWQTLEARRGDEIVVSPARTGVRSYIAIEGGILVHQVLGSRSTDLGGGFGGKVLATGDRLEIGDPPVDAQRRDVLAYPADARTDSPSPAVLRVVRGHDAESLGTDIMDALLGSEYRCSARSGRQGLRLDGAMVSANGAADRISAGVCAGCVQVTGDGLPLLLLAEHQTTGGYPVALCVITADMPRAAQIRPGDAVRFSLVGFREAGDALAAATRRLASLGPDASAGEPDIVARLSDGFFEGA